MSVEPIRVYVGLEEEQEIPFRVLRHTILARARSPVEVIPLNDAISRKGLVIPRPSSRVNRQHTPFSFQRFAIPALNDYRGCAVYLDSDMQVFDDVASLVDFLEPDDEVVASAEPPGSGRNSQISVMVLNCSKLRWDVADIVDGLDRGRYSYRELFSDLPIANAFVRRVPSRWNDLERYRAGDTALTHYTDMETQPWLHGFHPLGALWCGTLLEAIAAGALSVDDVAQNVLKGWVRPSLAIQVEMAIADPLRLSAASHRLDRLSFTPPHRLGIVARSWARSLAGYLTAYGCAAPSRAALLMRNAQAIGYGVFKLLRARHLNSRL
jgi:hypothetical protein